VFGELSRLALPHVTVMGGGYGKDIADSVDVYEATVEAALQAASR
jgi:hypothetical protein